MPSTREPSLEELREESERSREALASTVGELRETVGNTATELKTLVSPAHIKKEIKNYVREERESLVQVDPAAGQRQSVADGCDRRGRGLPGLGPAPRDPDALAADRRRLVPDQQTRPAIGQGHQSEGRRRGPAGHRESVRFGGADAIGYRRPDRWSALRRRRHPRYGDIRRGRSDRQGASCIPRCEPMPCTRRRAIWPARPRQQRKA